MGNLQANLSLSTRMSATIGAANGHTGSTVSCDHEYGLVRAWAYLPTREYLLNHSSSSLLEESLSSIECISDPFILARRGRPEDQTGPNPEPMDMGPPPKQLAQSGRYNLDGQPALYLSDSEDGVLRELAYEPMYIQRFVIPTGSLRIADLRQIGSDSFLSGTMWHSEFAESDGYPTKVFSQTVGEIVGRHFDGMAVRGVRGESGRHYSNIVILRNLESWQEWLETGTVPYKPFQ